MTTPEAEASWHSDTYLRPDGRLAWCFDDTGEAYDAVQCSVLIKDGDLLVIKSEGVVGIALTWPIAVTRAAGFLHHPNWDVEDEQDMGLTSADFEAAVLLADSLRIEVCPEARSLCTSPSTKEPDMTQPAIKITPGLQAAIDAIAENNGAAGAQYTREQLKGDNMTWFCGDDLIEWGVATSAQSAGGVIHALMMKGLVMVSDNKRPTKDEPHPANLTLTDAAIDMATSLAG